MTAALLAIAVFIFSNLIQQCSAQTAWTLKVEGFGRTVAYGLVTDGEGKPYIPIELLAEALMMGLDEDDGAITLRWGGKSAVLRDGGLSVGQMTLPGPIRTLYGRLCFPLKGLTAFGIKLSVDDKSLTATAAVPRGTIVSMYRTSGDGPTAFAVQLSFAPAKVESFILSAPDRLVIDIGEAAVDPAQSKEVSSAEATRIRASMNRPGVARVVLELTKAGTGAVVYQDRSDPSLIRIAFPGRVTFSGYAESEGRRGFEIRATAGLSSASIAAGETSAVVNLPDFLPDKALKLSGDGFSIKSEPNASTSVLFETGGMPLGAPVTTSNSMFIPLLNVITGIAASSGGGLHIDVDFAMPLGLFFSEGIEDNRGLSISLKGTASNAPSTIIGMGEAGISFRLEEDAEGSRLIFTGFRSEVREIKLSEDGKRISIALGGSITEAEQSLDRGVSRISLKHEGISGEVSMTETSEGGYIVSFPGITSLGPGIAETLDIPGKGDIVWERTKDGLTCTISMGDGLAAVLRPSRQEGLSVIDIGYELESYAVESRNGNTVITITTSGPSAPDVFRLREPDRLVVDLPGYVEAGQRSEELYAAGTVRMLRSGQNTIGVARIVFDLGSYSGHTWQLSEGGDKISITLADKLAGLAGRLILLDPGHGGTDGGAVGNSLIEKEVNLDIALKLRQLLEESGATVIMTRTKDVRLDLADRSSLGNLILPDAVICIHSNSVISDSPNGTETYYYSAEPLSSKLASTVHKSLVERIKLANRGVFRKEYYMVKETLSPSVLIEIGFLSNPRDAAMLGDAGFRQKAAEGIYDGLVSYFGGEAHESWASVREVLLKDRVPPSYSQPEAAWPGLMLPEPWVPMPPALDESIITREEKKVVDFQKNDRL